MTLVLILLGAVGLAVSSYWWLERAGRRAWPAVAFRAMVWGILGVLVLNLSCATKERAGRPIALVDASLSFSASDRWAPLRDSLMGVADVWYFGDQRPARDSSARGTSRLGPVLGAAAATDRPIIVFTDGELEDVGDIPPDVMDRAEVRVFERTAGDDVALVRVHGPARVTQGDSIILEGEVLASKSGRSQRVGVLVEAGSLRLARASIDVGPGERRGFGLRTTTRSLGAGPRLLTIRLDDGADDAPQNDVRLHFIEIVPTPGVVLVANPPDWDAKFLYRALREVSDLPVRGYGRVTDAGWRTMDDLEQATETEVRRAVRRADLVVIKGRDESWALGAGTRAVWRWPSGENGAAVTEADWYLSALPGTPLSQAFLGLPVDSFPPATQVARLDTTAGGWTALTAQAGRRGPLLPVVTGYDDSQRRHVVVAAQGLWRWGFRGGSSEQGYRSFIAATTSWLLGGADSSRGPARVVDPVVQQGRPVLFRTTGRGPETLAVRWSGPQGARTDTLRFDGAGEAQVWLPPGEYRYRFDSGGAPGVIGVEEYSDEWIVRPPTVTSTLARMGPGSGRRSAREALWLFGLGVLGLIGEWTVRRRLGLR